MAAVTTWYLEQTAADQLRPAAPAPLDLRRLRPPDPARNAALYRSVGAAWAWRDRLAWTDAQWRDWADRDILETWLLDHDGRTAGYVELERQDDATVQVAYFGLEPWALGRRWGGHALTLALRAAWTGGTRRVWVHTCSLDHPAARANYEARGMRLYDTIISEPANP